MTPLRRLEGHDWDTRYVLVISVFVLTLIAPAFGIQNVVERSRYSRKPSAIQNKIHSLDNNVSPDAANEPPDLSPSASTSNLSNRFKTYYRRVAKPVSKRKHNPLEQSSDLDTAATVNRPKMTFQRRVSKPENVAVVFAVTEDLSQVTSYSQSTNSTDLSPVSSTDLDTTTASTSTTTSSSSSIRRFKNHHRRVSKPTKTDLSRNEQDLSGLSPVLRNKIQRRISKPSTSNAVSTENENDDIEGSFSTTNRVKIRRRISSKQQDNSINSASATVSSVQESKLHVEDQEPAPNNNRFKVGLRQHKPSPFASRKSDDDVVSTKSEDGYKIVCYYTNWSQYRPKIGKFLPEDIDPNLCTHVIFAFGWLKKGRLSSFESNDETKDAKIGLYDRIKNLKKANPKLKTLLAIGGWSFGTQKFKDMSATRYSRQTFIYSAVPFLRTRGFDGLDVDWEYPKGTDDKKNYVLLLKELREAFEAEAQEVKKPRLLLTAAVPVGPDNIKSGYDVPAVASYLDFINLMAYDFHGKWERETGHNAPLYAPSSDSEWRKQLSVDNAASMWVRLGAPKEKLIIGMPTYGRTFTLANPLNFKVNSPASGGGKAGEYTKEGGFLAYYEVCDILRNGATYIWDDEMKVPYAVAGDQWIGFDDERSIRNKMQWLKQNNFGGAMIWTVDMDDFTGNVCGGDVKYPLIGAIREELLGIKRDNNAKDIDWSKVANSLSVEEITKPPATKISLSEILNKVKSPSRLQTSSAALVPSVQNARPPQILCYMTSWSQKRPSAGKFLPENIDPTLCTHVIYAFGTLKENRLTIGEDKEDESYEKLMTLREKNANLKILLAIGGWTFGSTPFKELTGNVFRMNQFVYEAIEFLREYKFNGLDVDWEYPRGADDKAAYVNLLKELRTAFEGEAKTSGQPRLLLSAAVPASFEAIAAGYDVPEISKYLDFINVMAYDLHGQWERQVGHNSPLYPLESATSYQKKLTVDYSAREWVRQGAPKEKLMIGMPTYGRSFTLVDSTKFDIGAPASGGGAAGKYTGEAGFMAYYEICEFLHIENTTLVWDNEQQVPFAYRGDQWVGFDDERSLKTKMAWLKQEGFGGIMVWSVDMDDYRGTCGTGKYPLLNAMRQELDGYTVKLEYDGPYEASSPNAIYSTKDPTVVSCEEEDGHISYHADKADCTMYYMCEGERKHHMPCPSNLVFNPKENVCDWPENVEGCTQHTPAPPAS